MYFLCTLPTSEHGPEKALPVPEGLRHWNLCYSSANVSTRPLLRTSRAPYMFISSSSSSNCGNTPAVEIENV